MTRKELYAALCARIPPTLSEPWDHDGAMCVANEEREVRRVLCTLDVTDAVIDLAVREKYDVILSHHPLIFHGVDALTEHDATARRLLRLVREDIAVYSFHTRLDAVEGGVNDTLASLLELRDVVPLGEGDTALGMERVNDWCRAQGYTATRINRRLGITVYPEENYTSAVDCARLLTAVATETCVSAEQSQYMLSLLQEQTLNWKIPAGIPRRSGVRIGNKTGELANLAEHDAAIVIGSDLRYVLCVLCEYPGRETNAIGTIAEISACAYRSFSEALDKS